MTTTDALDLIRDLTLTVDALARRFEQGEAWVAGAIDAVTGDTDWSLFAGDAIPQSERDDYADGFRAGVRLIEEEAEADGWRELYAVAEAEALQAAEPLPAYVGADDDLPF